MMRFSISFWWWTLLVCSFIYVVFRTVTDAPVPSSPKIENQSLPVVLNGLDKTTGLVINPGFELIRSQCTGCHSAKLVTQNRLNRSGWESAIRWMQQTQGLWDLGDYESKILDYLEINYGPEPSGRRKNLELDDRDWYPIQE